MSELIAAPPAAAPAPATPGVPGQNATQTQQNQPGQSNQSTEQGKNPEQQYVEVKVNGQMRRYTIEQARARLAMAEGAHEKFETAAQKEKKYNDWKQSVQKDALAALMDPELGLTKDQIRTKFEHWYKENFIDPETMSPEQREALKWRQEAEKSRKELDERNQKEQSAAEEVKASEMRQSVQKEIIGVLEESGLPKTRFFANRIAFYMGQNLAKGYDAPKEVVINQVKEEGVAIIGSLVESATGAQLAEYFPDMVKKIRQFDTEQLRNRFNPTQNGGGQGSAGTGKPRQGGRSMKDVDNYLNELRRSKR